jgi:hypothetical protein
VPRWLLDGEEVSACLHMKRGGTRLSVDLLQDALRVPVRPKLALHLVPLPRVSSIFGLVGSLVALGHDFFASG